MTYEQCHPRASGGPVPSRHVAWIPACAGMTYEQCHPRGSGGPVLSQHVAWIPACAGMTYEQCHPRGSGGPVLSRHVAWIPACAGMTFSPVVGPRGDGEEAHAIIPAAMPGLGAEGFRGIFLYLSAAFGAFLVALWLSLVFWTWRDIPALSQHRFLRVLAPLLVLLLNLPGVIVYLILRPRLTLEEEYERALEEEALLSGIESH